MASIFKKGGRGHWVVKYYDHLGRRREHSTKTTDRRAAERIGSELETQAALRREGVIDADLDDVAKARRLPLATHIDAFAKVLRAKGDSERHVKETVSLIERVLTAGEVRSLGDLRATKVQLAIGALHTAGRSARTCNKALLALKSFSRWLDRDRRLRGDPLAELALRASGEAPCRVRRELDSEAFQKLLGAAQDAGEVLGLSGVDRAVLYRVAAGTGLRASELASLTPASFELEGASPSIVLEAAYSKRRRRDVQPLRPDLAEVLRPWLASRPRGKPIFPVQRLAEKTARMLRVDLMAAGIPYKDARGRFADFHALRHTYVSQLVRSGASVKVAQELARHSTPLLTVGRYAHTSTAEVLSALAGLEPVSKVLAAATRAGTEPELEATAEGVGPHQNRHHGAHVEARPAAMARVATPRAARPARSRKIAENGPVRGGARRPAKQCEEWALWGSNPGPTDYESAALTN
jgi:integrase/recombinase XerD